MTAGLIALALAGVMAVAVIIFYPQVLAQIVQIFGATFLFVLGLTLVSLLVIAIFDIDVTPIFRKTGVALTRNTVVDFYAVFPDQYEVQQVNYQDTDGDEEKEWVVFYQFDLADGRRPYAGVVYDYDRGDPSPIFTYQLLPPDRDYLSEGVIRFELQDVVGASEAQPVPELFVYGQLPRPEEEVERTGRKLETDLTIFRHIPNSFDWEFPRDEPRRYQVIGTFRGDGGVFFDEKAKTVTVLDRAGYDRSQLAVETVYELDDTRETYMSVTDPQQLSAPVSSRVVFAGGMPTQILDTPYPEKLVLGFYEMLAAEEPAVPPRDFLTGHALIEFDNNNLPYFGFGSVPGKITDVNEVTVTQLSYAPETEQIGASATVLGEEPNFQTASVAFQAEVGKSGTSTPAPIVWAITVVNGRWRIDHRLQ